MKHSYNFNFLLFFLFLLFLLFLLLFYVSFFQKKEGFQTWNKGSWGKNLIDKFNIFQTTMNNNNTQFNLDLLQKQATPKEAQQMLNTGLWPWADDLKQEYLEYLWSNPMIKINPNYALNYAMKTYNQTAVKQLLAWNTKEGQFLLYGGDLGYAKNNTGFNYDIHFNKANGINTNDTIKCVNGNVIKYENEKNVNVSNVDIPNVMPGFSFINKPCNPCVAIDGDFSCPFRLNVKGDDNVSNVWKSLWGL